MLYTRTQTDHDKKIGLVRYDGVCFTADARESEIETVFNEIRAMNDVGPALMTAGALASYMELPKYVVRKMESMEVGTSFTYEKILIKKWSEHTYNGKNEGLNLDLDLSKFKP